ncbi:TFIIB-type zinc ribbon-containing protein [Pseudooceanicola sp.]|jgi:Zn-finger nucleic acid-binding protein|uniref:TFIIB-type zinc ribbon-containing protein n=1 Tax=Pseudooceanicola sp. TaxID=1914328 RepID=UPI004059ADF9
MKCPVDGAELMMTDRQGVEIDYCPKCRGVWLDRGELDKIIDRSAHEHEAAARRPVPQQPQPAQPQAQHHEPRYDPRYRDDGRHYYKRKKRKSLLSEIFDFD